MTARVIHDPVDAAFPRLLHAAMQELVCDRVREAVDTWSLVLIEHDLLRLVQKAAEEAEAPIDEAGARKLAALLVEHGFQIVEREWRDQRNRVGEEAYDREAAADMDVIPMRLSKRGAS